MTPLLIDAKLLKEKAQRLKRDMSKFLRNANAGSIDLNEFLKSIFIEYENAIKECICTENPLAQERSTHAINPAKDETSVDYSIKSDKGKYKPTLCHPIIIEAVSRVREHGASRYGGTETWKRVEEQRYKDALYRHWLAYLENPDGIDAESGFPHLYHVACNVDFLLEMQRERMQHKPVLVEQERFGKWIKMDAHAGMEQYKCSACDSEVYVPECMGKPIYEYCPCCGAEMEVEENGETDRTD